MNSRLAVARSLSWLALVALTHACSGEPAPAPRPAGPAKTVAAGPAPEGPSAKRVGPAAVAPVTIDGVRYEVVHFGKRRGLAQNGGYIAAIDAATGQERWLLKVYEVHYDPAMESDVQDVFITAMSRTLFGGKLSITDENGRMYRVDPATRTVERR